MFGAKQTNQVLFMGTTQLKTSVPKRRRIPRAEQFLKLWPAIIATATFSFPYVLPFFFSPFVCYFVLSFIKKKECLKKLFQKKVNHESLVKKKKKKRRKRKKICFDNIAEKKI